jgi:polyhydroxybutyrate depolymerase
MMITWLLVVWNPTTPPTQHVHAFWNFLPNIGNLSSSILPTCLVPASLQDWNFVPRWNVTNDTARNIEYFLGTERFIRHDGYKRWFVEYQPDAMARDGSAPLLIVLHFGGGNMRSSVGFGRLAEKDPFLKIAWDQGVYVMSPNGARRRRNFPGIGTKGIFQQWNDLLGGDETGLDDVGFIVSLIDWAVANRNVNPKRVYLTGISNGGMLSQRIMIEHPELIAAVGTVGASLPNTDVPFPNLGVPIVLIHGTADDFVPYEGGIAAAGRGIVRSVNDTLDYFIAANGADPDPIETLLPDTDPNDGCRIASQYYAHNTTPVLFYRMDGGGHMTPGVNVPQYIINCGYQFYVGTLCFDAVGAQLIWDFMSKYTR